jgi:hypothetical protein
MDNHLDNQLRITTWIFERNIMLFEVNSLMFGMPYSSIGQHYIIWPDRDTDVPLAKAGVSTVPKAVNKAPAPLE